MYIATSYIGRDYTPGEIIRENLPKETIERLLKAGAIRKAAPAHAAEEAPQEPPETELPPEGEQKDTETEEATEEEAEGAEEPETAEEPEDEIDEEAEAPEIDVMDGLVPAAAEEPKKPARTATRKAAGGKTAKGGKTK
jgi:hypothetical protein